MSERIRTRTRNQIDLNKPIPVQWPNDSSSFVRHEFFSLKLVLVLWRIITFLALLRCTLLFDTQPEAQRFELHYTIIFHASKENFLFFETVVLTARVRFRSAPLEQCNFLPKFAIHQFDELGINQIFLNQTLSEQDDFSRFLGHVSGFSVLS
jgi:hypothetical protein